jgi:DNA-binding MarR family transcriptional regulator
MESHVLGNILRIGRCCQLYRRRELRDTDLHPAQHLFISHICRRPGLAQEELIGELRLDKTTVTHQLTKLEEQGYIRREAPAEDGRCRRVYPTEKAEAVYPRIHGVFEDFTEGILAGFSDEEQAELERLTERLRTNALRLTEPERGTGP